MGLTYIVFRRNFEKFHAFAQTPLTFTVVFYSFFVNFTNAIATAAVTPYARLCAKLGYEPR